MVIVSPLEDLEIDFAEIKPYQRCKYLLVLVCTYFGWPDTFPTKTGKASKEYSILLKNS